MLANPPVIWLLFTLLLLCGQFPLSQPATLVKPADGALSDEATEVARKIIDDVVNGRMDTVISKFRTMRDCCEKEKSSPWGGAGNMWHTPCCRAFKIFMEAAEYLNLFKD